MSKIVSVKCAACGAVLKVQENAKVFKCEYCGSEHLLATDEADLSNQLEQMAPGLERAASEMAIKRLKEELEELEKQAQARLKDIETKKDQALLEIEHKRSDPLSSPEILSLQKELESLQQEQENAKGKGKNRLARLTVFNSFFGLVGALIVFVLSFAGFALFFALGSGVLIGLHIVDATSEQVTPYIVSASALLALVIVLLFEFFMVLRHRHLAKKVLSKQQELQGKISERNRTIVSKTAREQKVLNEQTANEILAVKLEVEAAREAIRKEIREKQEQLEKHYKRVNI